MEIEDSYNSKLIGLDQNDPNYVVKKNSLEMERTKDLEGNCLRKKKQLRNSTREIDVKIKELENDPKTKTLTEFDQKLPCTVK